ncbi:T9SS type A sorting domain-containing protein [Flavobacterium caeni]|uniref:Conserved repeat domain-containing protein/Por secretion system C-terminal sorting domain-containing protein n=1 Tax=Flavobacterium caeni TaxID=490189 RepID=A0A1G5IDJ8_9FLAO|nr:T9SS type A sorting domain-containing protein [Flavobacterium caeni]SCY73468.1 conserved repeat domain-containing protein/Por secretion system C-terminal sorting domain-containing protein [Flavobacterium caeni]
MKKLLLFLLLGISGILSAQTITGVSPNAADAGETLQVTITGNNTHFTTISSTEGVWFYGGITTNALDLVSDTLMHAMITVPSSTPAGFYDLFVYDNFGQYSFLDALQINNNNNTIVGNISVDTNNNGCDGADLHPHGIRVNLTGGSSDQYTFTDISGNYIFYVGAGNFTVTPQPEFPYFTSSPSSDTVNFATVANLSQTRNFCVVADGVHNDLYVKLLEWVPARPGFDATYRLVYKNNGNQPISGSLNVTFDDSRLDYVSATTAPVVTPNNLDWTFANLAPFETRNINFVLNVNSPMETPAVNINDVLDFTATVNPVAGDETPANNVSVFNQVVVGSYDPNDKAVAEGPEINIADVGDYLHYLIRFQNSGTFLAENVRVQDMLAANLDVSTLEVVSASHAYRSTLTHGNKLEFFFDNIMLPAEMDDEPGSHGFVAFKIKPAAGVGLGSVIENTAEIYFDFNFPIITNTVTTTVTELATAEFDAQNNVVMYPNPARDVLRFETKDDITAVKIFNQLGQLVKSVDQNGIKTINVSELSAGTYLVQISTTKGSSVAKLMKY